MIDALRGFLDAEVSTFEGLPVLRAADIGIDLARTRIDEDPRGEPPEPGEWVGVRSTRYADGLRCWLDGDRVVLLEGLSPNDDDGEPAVAPELGIPDAEFDTILGSVPIERGERVFASRGLAVRLNPANGILLSLAAFAPTTAERYRRALRPVPLAPIVMPLEWLP